ncbi:MAG: hypothetical protein IIZ27_02800 [Solobacterium sp.]|nr:hypothetical protein [Solobacterium sp.]
MALIHLNFESRYLFSNTDVNIILPDMPRTEEPQSFYRSGKKYKVLWLLHGTFGDYTDWLRKSSVELYACEKDLVVVMPSALNSDYVDWDNFALGYHMYSYLTEELMPLVYGWLPVSDKREDNFIAGLSMGGAGASLYAFNHPDKFAGVYIMSASPRHYKEDITDSKGFNFRAKNVIANAGGFKAFTKSYQNTWEVLRKQVKKGVELPRIIAACGTADPLVYKNFKEFEKYTKRLKIDAEFIEIEGYSHEWRFWDICVQDAINKFVPSEETAGNAF